MYKVEIRNGFINLACCLTCEYYAGKRCVKTYCGQLCVYTDDPTYPKKPCQKGKDTSPNIAPCSSYKKWSGC